MSELQIDFLCPHFELDGFNCGEPLLNEGLASRLTTPFDPEDITVLVAHEDMKIRGYAALMDLLLVLDDDDIEARCFFIAALAVDERWQGADLGADLMRRCYAIRRHRSTRKHYAATVVTSFFDRELEVRYRRLRFRPVAGNEFLWFRRPRS